MSEVESRPLPRNISATDPSEQNLPSPPPSYVEIFPTQHSGNNLSYPEDISTYSERTYPRRARLIDLAYTCSSRDGNCSRTTHQSLHDLPPYNIITVTPADPV